MRPDQAIRNAIDACVEGRLLSEAEMQAAMQCVLAGHANDAQVAGFAIAMRMRGETAAEIEAAARAIRDAGKRLDVPGDGPLLDTCGTGGDGANTFNISTTAAVVVAACGVRVAKHGNRAVSSQSGSADVLEILGISMDASHAARLRVLQQCGITFLFAPAHHAALRHASHARKSLGIRTIFNLLGPLANPAGATHQVVGSYDAGRLSDMARALGGLGVQGAWVVHGEGGLDEIATHGETRVAQLLNSEVHERVVVPEDFGLERAPLESLLGGSAQTNAQIARAVWSGEERGGPRTAVLLNAAAGLCAAGVETEPAQAAARAADAIDRGAAQHTFDAWVAASRSSEADA